MGGGKWYLVVWTRQRQWVGSKPSQKVKPKTNKLAGLATPTAKAAFSVKANILGDYACKHLVFSETSHRKTPTGPS